MSTSLATARFTGIKHALLAVCVFLIALPCAAGAASSNYLTAKTVVAPVYGAAPSKGASVTDAATGATLEKKTVYSELTPASNRSMVVYSRFSPTNSSNEYLLVHGDNSTSSHVYRLSDNARVATLTWDGTRTIGEVNEIRWDYTGKYPNRVYFVVGKKFYRMDVLTENGAPTLIRDFGLDFAEGHAIANDVEGDSSNDSRYWAWQVLDKTVSPYVTRLIFTYDKETDSILGVLRPSDVGQTGSMSRPNMVEISPLGTKVITHYGAASTKPSLLDGAWVSLGNGVWELAGYKAKTSGNNAFSLVTANGVALAKMSGSAGSGASITGDNQYANNSTLDRFWVRLAGGADPNSQTVVANWGLRPADVGTVMDGPRAWDLNFTNPVVVSVSETHSGWAFDAQGREWFVSQNNRTDWIEARDILTGKAMNILYHGDAGWSNGFHFGKFYDRSQRGWLMVSTYAKVNSQWGNNQVMMVELKPAAENPVVWRVSPSYNNYQGNYRDEGSAALSQDGKSILWTGNWGAVDGHGEVYRALLPDDWFEHFPGSLHPDTKAPSVTSFSVPATVASLAVAIDAFAASDGVGVTGYYLGESAAKPDPAASGWSPVPPASYLFAAAGSRVLCAFARDAAGNVSEGACVPVEIALVPQPPAPPGDSVAPVVSVTASSLSVTKGAVVTLRAEGSDNVGVVRVEFLVNGLLLKTVTAAPYTVSWDTYATAAGTYYLSARAYDAAGNVGTSNSVTVKVTVPKKRR